MTLYISLDKPISLDKSPLETHISQDIVHPKLKILNLQPHNQEATESQATPGPTGCLDGLGAVDANYFGAVSVFLVYGVGFGASGFGVKGIGIKHIGVYMLWKPEYFPILQA